MVMLVFKTNGSSEIRQGYEIFSPPVMAGQKREARLRWMSRPSTSCSAKTDMDVRHPATPRLRRALVPVRRSFSEGGHKAGHDEFRGGGTYWPFLRSASGQEFYAVG